MKTIKSNCTGSCPVCDNESIQYGEVSFEGEQCYFPWTCLYCGQTGEECYNMEFVGHNIDFDDESLEIEDYMIGTAIKTKEERKNEFVDILTKIEL